MEIENINCWQIIFWPIAVSFYNQNESNHFSATKWIKWKSIKEQDFPFFMLKLNEANKMQM